MSPGARSGQEIQAALGTFVTRWADYGGGERAEAQTFLNELFACYGTDRKESGARFEDFEASAGFMDLHWPEVCVVEMKAPSRADTLHQAREQVFRYWKESSDAAEGHPAARWVVLCAFQRFEVWEPGRFPDAPRVRFDLEDLPDRYEVLQFLAGEAQEPVFTEHHKTLTQQAATTMAQLYQTVAGRAAAPLDEVQRFVMQAVWTFFAEDLGMLDGYPLQRLIATLRSDLSRSSAAEIGHLFRVLNKTSDHNRLGMLAGTRYVNGDLFRDAAEVNLEPTELDLLAAAAEYDWRQVNPTIFGSLMEGVLGEQRRGELGAHYTHEADILKIVYPTIVRPWRERIAAAATPGQAHELLDELCRFRVLDPACGCGNFLYIAYRELRGLEHQLKDRIHQLARDTGQPIPAGPWPYYPLGNLHGIDIEGVSVLITRVTLWMGHRQMIDSHGEAENPLPLVDLAGIRTADALRESWPEVDCIIGNPPFFGSQYLRGHFGGDYIDWLKTTFNVGVKDYCVYWFRLTHQRLQPGQRAGLVGTNSVSQNRARSASLDYITSAGGIITDAISSQKWPGEAKVHVSLVNWIKQPAHEPETFTVDGQPVPGINASLQAATPGQWEPTKLTGNAARCFQGPIPIGEGFLLTEPEARTLLAREDADYSQVVRPYLTGGDLADDPEQHPSRWIIDFGLSSLEQAKKYPEALAIVRERVKPERDDNNRETYRRYWWRLGEPRPGMRKALNEFSRWIGSLAFGKRLLLSWQDAWTCPSGKIYVFAFDDEYSMGILQSHAHVAWAWEQGATLKADLSYTPTSVFQTFPWPDPVDEAKRDAVADACQQMLTRRNEICRRDNSGLTTVYNAMDEGAYTDLAELHRRLDEAVAACYGWPASIAQDDTALVDRLRTLNQEIVEGNRTYAPFATQSQHLW